MEAQLNLSLTFSIQKKLISLSHTMAGLTSRSFLSSFATTIAAVIFLFSRSQSLSLIDFPLSHGVVSNRMFLGKDLLENLLAFGFARKAKVGF